MIEALKNLFAERSEAAPENHTIELAAAALMVEVMRADDELDPEELHRILSLLGDRFDLGEDESRELLQLAQSEIDDSIGLHEFTQAINRHWSNGERQTLLQHLWSVAYADGRLDAHERHVIRKIAALLYLNEKQIYAAKERARRQG